MENTEVYRQPLTCPKHMLLGCRARTRVHTSGVSVQCTDSGVFYRTIINKQMGELFASFTKEEENVWYNTLCYFLFYFSSIKQNKKLNEIYNDFKTITKVRGTKLTEYTKKIMDWLTTSKEVREAICLFYINNGGGTTVRTEVLLRLPHDIPPQGSCHLSFPPQLHYEEAAWLGKHSHPSLL